MSRNVTACASDAPLSDAAQRMFEHDCGIIPVTEASGKIIGVITDRDICRAALLRHQTLDQISVRDAMAKSVISCHVDDTVETAERLMRDFRIRRVPVVDQHNCVVGLLSLNDIAREAADERARGNDREVKLEDVSLTLAAICRPRKTRQLVS